VNVTENSKQEVDKGLGLDWRLLGTTFSEGTAMLQKALNSGRGDLPNSSNQPPL
jgi:hypothetical protein